MSAIHTPWRRLILIAVGITAAICAIVIAFLWPSVTASAKHLPISVAGPAAQAQVLEKAIDKQSPDTFKFTTVDTRANAVKLIEERKDYGSIVLGASPEILYSNAASPVAAQLIEALAAPLQSQLTKAAIAGGAPSTTQVSVATTNVVPLASGDPRGAVLAASLFPIVMGGMLGGIAITIAVVGVWRRAATTLLYAIFSGFALTSILQGWFGALQGDYLTNVTAISLAIFGMTGVIVGFVSIVGRAGLALGPVLFLLIANPIAGVTSPMEFIPAPWGAIGQAFPPGAVGTLLRDLSYFPKADTASLWLVLGGWAVLGLVFTLVGHFRNRGAAARFAIDEAIADSTPERILQAA